MVRQVEQSRDIRADEDLLDQPCTARAADGGQAVDGLQR